MAAVTLQLLQQQCMVPEVSTAVHIDNYLRLCMQLYADSLESHDTLSVRYVNIKRFLMLVTKLHAHHGFSAPSVRKQRLFFERCMRNSLAELEAVVGALRDREREQALHRAKQQPQQQQQLAEEDLFDLLEGDVEEAPAPAAALASALAPAPVAAPVAAPASPPDRDRDRVSRALDVLRVPGSSGATTTTTTATATAASQSVFVSTRNPAPTPMSTKSATKGEYLRGPAAYREFAALRGDASTAAYSAAAGSGSVAAEAAAPTSAGLTPGVTHIDAQIVAAVLNASDGSVSRVQPGVPLSSELDFRLLDEQSIPLVRDDFYVSYGAILRGIPTELQLTPSAVETNRCFFLHLGIAVSINPFLLQTAFRSLASKLLLDTGAEDASLREDILSSVVCYAGFVDANALIWLFLEELSPYRICLLSGTREHPIISTFRRKGAVGVSDVLLHCDGQHFTLLRPPVQAGGGGSGSGGNSSALPRLLRAVGANAGIIQEHELECAPGHSVADVMRGIL